MIFDPDVYGVRQDAVGVAAVAVAPVARCPRLAPPLAVSLARIAPRALPWSSGAAPSRIEAVGIGGAQRAIELAAGTADGGLVDIHLVCEVDDLSRCVFRGIAEDCGYGAGPEVDTDHAGRCSRLVDIWFTFYHQLHGIAPR